MKCIAISNVMLIYELRDWVETTKFYCGLCREWLFCVGEGRSKRQTDTGKQGWTKTAVFLG